MPLSDEERTRILSLGEDTEAAPAAPAFPEVSKEDDVDPLEGWESPTTVRRPIAVPAVDEDTAPRPAVESPSYVGAPEPGPMPEPEPASPEPTETFDRPHRHKRARHGCLSSLLWLVMLVVLGFMAIRCIPAEYAAGRAIPELASFVPLMVFPTAVCAVLALWWRRRVLAVVSIAALATLAWWHAGYFIPGERVSDEARTAVATVASTEDSAARIMTLNTNHGGASAEEIVALVRAQNVEVLCLQELTDDFIDGLYQAGIGDLLPYYVISDAASEVSNGGRNGIWTLAPTSNVSGSLLPIETSSMPAASITVGGQTVRIVSVHPNSPVRGAQDLWESGLSVIGSLSDYNHAYLIMGDFNSTWDHARFRELLGTSFADAGASAGEGFHMTYPSSDLIPSLIEIDHIVYARNSGIVVSDLSTSSVPGTDHQALLGTLEVR